MDVSTKVYIDEAVQNIVEEQLKSKQEAIANSTELELDKHEERKSKTDTDISLELKRYIEWELNNAVSDLKVGLKRIVKEETEKTLRAVVETSKELKEFVETEIENCSNMIVEKNHIQENIASEKSEKCNEELKVKYELETVYEHPDKITPSRGNLLTTIPTLGREFHIHFSFAPGSTTTGCRNIFHMSISGNAGNYGDCIPSVNFLSAKKCFSVISAVNGEHSYKQTTTTGLPSENTYNIDIVQEHNEGKYYMFKVYLNDSLMHAVLNYDARVFNSVNVYASDPWTNEQPGVMDDLVIKTRI